MRLLSLLSVLLIFLNFNTLFAQYSGLGGGEGKEDRPYLISTSAHLEYFGNQIEAGAD